MMCIYQDIHESCALFNAILVSFSLNVTDLCSVVEKIIFFKENNTLEAVVTSLTAEAGVTAKISREVPAGLFSINDLNVIAITVLDFEVAYKTFDIKYLISCVCFLCVQTSLKTYISLYK